MKKIPRSIFQKYKTIVFSKYLNLIRKNIKMGCDVSTMMAKVASKKDRDENGNI